MRLKWYYCLEILKTFKIWVFSEKKMKFFGKEPWNNSKTPIVKNVSIMRIKWYYCLRILKVFKVSFCLGKNGFFRKRALNCFKTANRAKKFSKTSQMVLLLKNSRNLQFLWFFCENIGFF